MKLYHALLLIPIWGFSQLSDKTDNIYRDSIKALKTRIRYFWLQPIKGIWKEADGRKRKLILFW